MKIDLKKRFISKMGIPNENGCMNWTASFRGDYEAFQVCEKKSKYKYNTTYYAHRIAYELFIGDIADGLCVLHKCDNSKCVNPSHLFIGTHKDNANDMMHKDRGYMKNGEKHFGSVLKDEDIPEIFKLSETLSQRDIAKKFNVSQSAIENILLKNTWKHISANLFNLAPKGRRPNQNGSLNPRAKLKEKDAMYILKSKGLITAIQLSKEFGISEGSVRNIWTRKTWRMIE